MKEWIVTVPIVGRVTVVVQAEDSDGAIEAALAGEWDEPEIDEFDLIRGCRGNVCHLPRGITATENE